MTEHNVNTKLPIVKELLDLSDVSGNCSKSIFSTLDGIERLDDWSIQMINSWADFPPKGVLEGRLTDFGSYDQCLSIIDNHMIGSAQYCSLDLVPYIPRPMPKQHNLFHKIPNLLPIDIIQNKSNALNIMATEASFFYWIRFNWFCFRENILHKKGIQQTHSSDHFRRSYMYSRHKSPINTVAIDRAQYPMA
ncbi:unnamed protein product [Medioppia subpectinata]|uniref:Nose resistant-to-fluoxetine protein N-terminal domain-containing protein n=1 Tax=Medioppia subpectinata TaxID=1979941 RepID=A0A7R9L4M2_9ACAR|nr:unnamed protein product [Medioppia subpectinata]CAG2115481.1 unnamed protein product [Medioppia subpectinata]